jgi:hypothetical protein
MSWFQGEHGDYGTQGRDGRPGSPGRPGERGEGNFMPVQFMEGTPGYDGYRCVMFSCVIAVQIIIFP